MRKDAEIAHEQGLQRQLSAGQMTMVAVGGSIGTGLLLGSAAAISVAGPSVILSFVVAAFLNWLVTMALGELASKHPAAGSFGVYGDLYLNEWAGFISRAGYWAAISISIGAELVASATYMQHWFPSVPAVGWVALLSVLLLLTNLRSVGDYGRFEYWFAMIKVITIAAFIVLGGALLFGRRVVPQYSTHGGFFPLGMWAPLLAMSYALYTFGGVEYIAITTGEARSRADISRAVRMTFWTLTSLYLGAIIVLVGVMPWNRAGVTESPFVTVFRSVRIPAASGLMNFVVLTAALSGANAALYAASRMLFSMARTGWAPAKLGTLNRSGSPTLALLCSSYGIVVALVLEKWAPANAFVWILGAALFGLMLSWMISFAAHVRFRKVLSAAELAELPLNARFGATGSALGFVLVVAAILHTWWSSRVSMISGITYLVGLTVAYYAIRTAKRGQVRPVDALSARVDTLPDSPDSTITT